MTSRVRFMFESAIPHDKEQKLRQWASDNAYTLTFVFALCVVTWALIIVTSIVGVR